MQEKLYKASKILTLIPLGVLGIKLLMGIGCATGSYFFLGMYYLLSHVVLFSCLIFGGAGTVTSAIARIKGIERVQPYLVLGIIEVIAGIICYKSVMLDLFFLVGGFR
ncbi:hypothetical protein [uncultured Ruminococcus sp.]|uniref:hypothetical protein n=1 Tax=uncultured Ruminococcus sp. TaxID=165186 RepID=UPI0025EB80FA|nr:hypothetical protein [uncultured Ruminococcus sp.]